MNIHTNLADSIDEYLPYVREAILEGFNDFLLTKGFMEGELGITSTFENRTYCSMIHESIKHRATIIFKSQDNSRVAVGTYNGVFGVLIKGVCFIRFKKLNRDFSASNISTRQDDEYRSQVSLPGIGDQILNLYAGYIPDKFWLSVQAAHIVCWNNSFQWQIDMNSVTTEQGILPFSQHDEQADDKLIERVIPKIEKLKERNK